MKKNTFFAVLLFCGITFAQEFAPLQLGNSWTYKFDDWGTISYSRWIDADTNVILDNKKYHKIVNAADTSLKYFVRLDTDGLYYVIEKKERPYYKKDMQLGDSVKYQLYPNFLLLFYYFQTDYWGVFNTPIIVKELTLDFGGLHQIWEFWSEEYGQLIQKTNEKDNFTTRILMGCVINGKLFGDTTTTSVSIDKKLFAKSIETLEQNYPNPFNPVTRIEYTISESGKVVLEIFDIVGNKIETLIDENQNQGKHSIDFKAANLSSGIYYYKLITANNIITKKMLYIK